MFLKSLLYLTSTALAWSQLDVAGGNHHTYVLTSKGEVLSMGQDLHKPEKGGQTYVGGKLGRAIDQKVAKGDDESSLLAQSNYNPGRRKVQGLDGVKVVKIASGQNDGGAISADGKLYMWGPNNHGQLGLGDTKQRRKAILVPLPEAVKDIAIGSAHTLVMTESGKVYSMGIGRTGLLGHGTKEAVLRPKLIEALADEVVVQVAAAQNTHSLFLTKDGKIFGCGSNRHGQLGITAKETDVPVRLASEVAFRFIAVGVHTSFAIDEAGLLWGWGSGDKAHFPRPDLDDLPKPTRLERAPEKLVAVAAGSRHTVVLNEAGEVFTWGLHTLISGQLGIGPLSESGSFRTPQRVKIPGKVSKLDSVANNVFVVTSDRVFGWGQTSHGRLGMPKNGAHQVKDAKGKSYHIAHSPVEIALTETAE